MGDTRTEKGGLSNERMTKLFEEMAQYIFERLSSANLNEEEIKSIFTDTIGFTDDEYAKEIGDYSRPKE